MMTFNFSMFVGEDGGIMHMTLWICVCSNCPQMRKKPYKYLGGKMKGWTEWESTSVKIKDPWHFNKWEQAHYNMVADGELVDLNWYPHHVNKWVTDWVSGWVGSQLILTTSKQMSEKMGRSQLIPSKWKQNERVIYIEATNERPTQTHLHKMYKGWTENPHSVQ